MIKVNTPSVEIKEPKALQITNFLEESNHIEQEWSQEAQDDSIRAWNYISGFMELSLENILNTHKMLMKTRDCPDSWKGKLRNGPVWVGGREGLQHGQIKETLTRWIERVNRVVALGNTTGIDLNDLIREQHISYEYIHPFFDGNGRTGRIFYNWTRNNCGLPIEIIKYAERGRYYDWFR